MRLRAPQEWADWIKFLTPPFVKSHSINAEVLAAGPHDARMLLVTMNILLKKNPSSFKGYEISGGLETSPAREQVLR